MLMETNRTLHWFLLEADKRTMFIKSYDLRIIPFLTLLLSETSVV